MPRSVWSGIDWLDRVYPEWRTRIDWDRLDMADARHCIFGQLLDPGEVEAKGGKGAAPRNGWSVIFFYLKDLYDSRDAAFGWLREHGHMESTEVWWRASFTRQP